MSCVSSRADHLRLERQAHRVVGERGHARAAHVLAHALARDRELHDRVAHDADRPTRGAVALLRFASAISCAIALVERSPPPLPAPSAAPRS